jgi:hypothetical protein
MTIGPLDQPFDLDALMMFLRERAFAGDEVAVRAISGIALLLLGFRNGDTFPSAPPTLYEDAKPSMN